MSASSTRRPLPALAFLLVLSVLAGVVWWRVLHRHDTTALAKPPSGRPSAICGRGGKAIALPAPRSVTIQVLNAADRTGLAAAVRDQLISRGFASAGVGNAKLINGVGEIHYPARGAAAATLLSYYLPGAKLVRISRSDAQLDLVLGTGFRTLASPAAVNQSVARAGKPC